MGHVVDTEVDERISNLFDDYWIEQQADELIQA